MNRLVAIACLVVVPPPSWATTCALPACGYNPACNNRAEAVSSNLWGELEPLDTGFLPAVRDQSPWSQDGSFLDGNHPFWNDVDTEGSWVFTSHNTGLHIWQHTAMLWFGASPHSWR